MLEDTHTEFGWGGVPSVENPRISLHPNVPANKDN
jgi:hypothetical protein